MSKPTNTEIDLAAALACLRALIATSRSAVAMESAYDASRHASVILLHEHGWMFDRDANVWRGPSDPPPAPRECLRCGWLPCLCRSPSPSDT